MPVQDVWGTAMDGLADVLFVASFNATTGFAGLSAILWLYAGLQTWRLMFLLDPDPDSCELTQTMRAGNFPHAIFTLFLLLWPVILIGVSLLEKLADLQRGAND